MANGIAEIFRVLGIFGTALILWTAVVCVALWRGQHETIILLWPYLFWTWVFLAGVMMSGFVMLMTLNVMESTSGELVKTKGVKNGISRRR